MAEHPELPTESLSEGMGTAVSNGSRTRLDDLTAQATLKYSIKDYNAAAELYSQATELQAELNGEMSSENADLLYAYGRCLYHVAVRNSDVLGSKVAGEKREEGAKKPGGQKQTKEKTIGEVEDPRKVADQEVITEVVETKEKEKGAGEKTEKENKPHFQFTGDENFDTSEEEDGTERDGEVEAPDEEEDDFVNAYEVLDLARVLLLRRLEEAEVGEGKAKVAYEAQRTMQLKERLADTYDLQAEISLEGERFPNAVVDLKAAVALKKELFPQESSLIAEAHYKLSLALEFSSVTQQKDENGEAEAGGEAHVDETMREEAAKEMEAAIASCKSRIKQEEARLGTNVSSHEIRGKLKVTKEDINEVKEMVKDMEQRLIELRQPPVSINDPTGTGSVDGANPLSGILGSILGESPAAQKARIEDALKDANDLTNLVKRKKPAKGVLREETESGLAKSNGKRRVEFADEVVNVGTGKKARISEGDDE